LAAFSGSLLYSAFSFWGLKGLMEAVSLLAAMRSKTRDRPMVLTIGETIRYLDKKGATAGWSWRRAKGFVMAKSKGNQPAVPVSKPQPAGIAYSFKYKASTSPSDTSKPRQQKKGRQCLPLYS
jgi:hypothetical protein